MTKRPIARMPGEAQDLNTENQRWMSGRVRPRRSLLRAWILPWILGWIVTGHLAAAASPPNLIVIMTDDQGYADVGFNGCTDIPTPHIDSIAANGVKFTSGYVAYSVCGPSRAAFMTGRYGQRFGFERNPQYDPQDRGMGLPLSEDTMPSVLRRAGYHCGAIGKWHLGATEVHHPLNRGFHEFYGHLGGGHRYFPEELDIKDSAAAKNESESYRTWILRGHEPVPPRKYLTDDFSDEAVEFVRRNHAKPFFLFLAYNAPHLPFAATEERLARFGHIKDEKRRTYAAMVSAVDDGVGRVLEELQKREIVDNTLVFFLSDNGGPHTKNGSRNTPLRGGKSDPWEGGIRVPFAAQWPSGLPRGVSYDHPVLSLDIFATIVGLSGVPIARERPLDGVNIVPYVTGKKRGIPHNAIFLRKYDQGIRAIRSGDDKMVLFEKTKQLSLFDLSKDISEKDRLSNPAKVRQLDQLWNDWNGSNIDPVFEGLTQLPDRKKKGKQARDGGKPASTGGQTEAEKWKEAFFKRHPEADTDKDGNLSWAEQKAYKEKMDAKRPEK